MRSIVRTWKAAPLVRELALEIIQPCANRDWVCEVVRIQEWVRSNIRFVGDVAEVETLHTPDLVLRQRSGDCDDHSILVASMLQAVGHPARFAAFDLGQGFQHVVAETPIGPYWQSVETTEPDFRLGEKPPGIKRTMVQRI